MLATRTILLALLLLSAACGGSEAGALDPAPPEPTPAAPAEELSLGSAEDEMIVDEEVVSSSALAALGGGGKSAEPDPKPPPPPPSLPVKDTGLGEAGARALSPQQIKRVIDKNMPQVTACYERELKGSPGLRGKVVVGFVIGADGRVRPPRIASDSTRSRLKRVVHGWRFPKAEGPADVEYPFLFKPRDF